MENCYGEISKNIQMDCKSPMVAGYTGRGLLFPIKSVVFMPLATENTRNLFSMNPKVGEVFYAIDNVFVDPYTGSSKQSTGESGRVMFQKTVQIRIPMRGGVISNKIVEAMHNSADGYVLVLEKKNKEDFGYLEAIGIEVPVKPTADGTTQNEYENGGDIVMVLQTTENVFETNILEAVNMDYPSTHEFFEYCYGQAGRAYVEPTE